MMRFIPLTALSAALLLSVPAAAKTNAQSETELPKAGKSADAEKKVCKRLETSGTRMAERVCLTKDEWKKVEEIK
jgi:hypothetical protein